MKIGDRQKKILGLVLSVVLLSANYVQAQTAPTPTSSVGYFPTLPPSEYCTKEKVLGTWRLLMVYETPAGRELERYVTNPLQYYVFQEDDRYGEYAGPLSVLTDTEISNYAIHQKDYYQQYVVDSKGIVFFYREGIAIDSLACFIVATSVKPFMLGQMMLMPPQRAAAGGRMVKVYQKILIPTVNTVTD